MTEAVSSHRMRRAAEPAAGAVSPPMAEAFRGFMTAYFTGVAVVTSTDPDGRPKGLTCNSLSSVTLSPPTLLVCLAVGTGTLAAVQASGGFAVNLLHDAGRPAAELFASPTQNRFDHIAWRRSPRLELPWLADDACAMAECRLTDIKMVGDHAVVFGEVTNVEHRPGSPLLYGRRAYGAALR